jgi:hypothetical protein
MYQSYEDEYRILSNEDYLNFNECPSIHSIENDSSIKDNSVHQLKQALSNNKNSCLDQSAIFSKICHNESTYNEKRIGKWTIEEDDLLRELVLICGGRNWKKISEHIKGRTPIQCLHRWTKILKPGLVKGPWSIEEDKQLIQWVKTEGPTKWSQCAEFIKGRNGKQCRERWFNSLNPHVIKGNWTTEEDYKLFYYYNKFGGKWSKIFIYFVGRSENSVKNRFYSTLRRFAAVSQSSGKKSFDSYAELERNLASADEKELSIAPSSIGLNDLKKLIPFVEETIRNRLMKINNWNLSDLKQFETSLLAEEKKASNPPTQKFKLDRPGAVNSNYIFEKNNDEQNSKQNNQIKPTFSKVNTVNIGEKFSTQKTYNFNLNFNSNNNGSFNLNDKKDSMEFQNSLSNLNYYKSMDIYSLEKDIADMCDSNLFFQDTDFNLDNQLDNILENMFSQKNAQMTNDPTKNCSMCFESPVVNNTNFSANPFEANATKTVIKVPQNQTEKEKDTKKNDTKSEVFMNLLSQLNGLEKLVKNAKKELNKFEKQEKTEDFSDTFIDNLLMN